MDRFSEVVRYIDALTQAKSEDGGRWEWGRSPFVTISRESGAGGHTLAEAVLAELERRPEPFLHGWLSFDDTLLRLLGDEARHETALRSLLSEQYYSGGSDYLHQILHGAAPQDVMLGKIFRSLRALAGVGKAVILGRGGVCLTSDLPGGVHVRLVAGRETRAATLKARLLLTAAQAERKVDELESRRRKLFLDQFGRDISDPELYDCVWNIDRVGIPEIARWIVDRVAARSRELQASQRAASRA